MDVLLNKIYGSDNGKFIYSVIILNESDLAECSVRHYCADSEDEVGDLLVEEEINEQNFIIEKCGTRKDDNKYTNKNV